MAKLFLKIKENDELVVLNEKCSKVIKLSIDNNKINVSKLDDTYITENIEIGSVSNLDLQRYYTFENYYQQMRAKDVSEKVKSKLEELMNYHEMVLHGYDKRDIKDFLYQVIIFYE